MSKSRGRRKAKPIWSNQIIATNPCEEVVESSSGGKFYSKGVSQMYYVPNSGGASGVAGIDWNDTIKLDDLTNWTFNYSPDQEPIYPEKYSDYSWYKQNKIELFYENYISLTNKNKPSKIINTTDV
jgi:hypothetical protein